jgi:hypothetical protein
VVTCETREDADYTGADLPWKERLAVLAVFFAFLGGLGVSFLAGKQ